MDFTRALVRNAGMLLCLVAVRLSMNGAAPEIAGCGIFPSDNVWNVRVDNLPVAGSSEKHVAAVGAASPLHPDFGSDPRNGIPINIAGRDARKTAVAFTYEAESDFGPYLIPRNPLTEAGSDHHLLVVDPAKCALLEMFSVSLAGREPRADSGAIYSLKSNSLRPDGWTSADAAGLPILPGLVRYEEVLAGEIAHAIRFTVPKTRNEHVWPARHHASAESGPAYMPMGARLRLNANFDVSGFSPTNRVILTALKKYGMILADNGSAWFISGVPDPRWNDSDLHRLTTVTGDQFEEVESAALRKSRNSGEVRSVGGAPH